MTRLGALLVALGAAARIVIAARIATPPAEWTGDPRVYLRVTEGLLRGELIPEAWIWPPGFPAAGALLAWAGGAGRGLLLASLVAGIVLPLLFLLAGRVSGRTVTGIVAAGIVAFYSEAILASAAVLSDAVALTLLVAAVLGAAVAIRSHRLPLSAGAGLLAGVAALTRPESLAATVPAAVLAHGRDRRRGGATTTYLVALALVLGPYVVGLHAHSGTWALTLKPHWNLLKFEAYETAPDYAEQRSAWGRTIDTLRDDEGRLDPRRIASSVDPRHFLVSGQALRHWGGHLAEGVARTSPLALGAVAIGLLGLAIPGPGRRSGTWALLATLPFLAVPLFVHPLGRFALPLLPGVAWGWGRLAAIGAAFVPRRFVPAAVIVPLLGLAGLGAVTSWSRAGDLAWASTRADIEAALGERRWADAERRLASLGGPRSESPEVWNLWGRLHEEQGRLDEAERAYRRAVEGGASPPVGLARLLATRGRVEEAQAALRGVPPDRRGAAYWSVAGYLAMRQGRSTEAVACFQRAEAVGGASGDLAFNLGLALVAAGRTEEAREAWLRAMKTGSPEVVRRARDALADLERR